MLLPLSFHPGRCHLGVAVDLAKAPQPFFSMPQPFGFMLQASVYSTLGRDNRFSLFALPKIV
jgi:hypothetical protein